MAETPPYWLVWREDGSPPTYRHRGPIEAQKEAERLARAHPGKSFVVLCPISRVTETRLQVENFDPTDDGIPF